MWTAALTFYVVMAGWFVFAAAMVAAFRRSGSRRPAQARDRSSIVGLILQAVSYSAVWTLRRDWRAPLLGQRVVPQALLAVAAIALVIGSIWMVVWAVRTLGRQWSLGARVIDGHELVTSGPYALVRHPIYSGMLGMLVATGIAVSYWWWVPIGIVLYLVGTRVRTRAEEGLLRAEFGAAYEAYAARVPAIVPFL